MAKSKLKATAIGCVEVDFVELTAVCAEQGKYVEAVLRKAKLNHHTADRIRRGLPIRRRSLEELLTEIGPQNLGRITRHDATAMTNSQPDETHATAADQLGEWTDEQVLTPWITTVNGLQYQIAKRRHKYDDSSWARVKCYDLSYLPDDARSELREHLMRHAKVCRRLQPNPRIPINERSFPDSTGKYWWVIDSWIDGVFLSDVLGKSRLPLTEVVRIGREILEGLKLLHDNGIVRRDLNPKFVLLRESDRSVVLTDFELAKLLDGGPTVGKDWPDDPYRAPEVGDAKVDARADIYSWGRIVVLAALGVLPAVRREAKPLRGSDLPEPLIELLVRCVALPPSDRPSNVADVLKILSSLS